MKILRSAPLLALLTIVPLTARAQTNIDTERFKPAVTHDGFVNTEGTAVRFPDDRWEFGAFVNYSRNTLVVVDSADAIRRKLVSGRLGLDLFASVTLAEPFSIGLAVPGYLLQTGDANPSFGGLGDVRLVPKLRILDDNDAVGLALLAELRAPTHTGDFSGGARNVVFAPKIAFDHRFVSGFRIGANVGVLLREKTTIANISAASEFTYSGAVSYRFGGLSGKTELGIEGRGAVGLTQSNREELPLEGLLFVKHDISPEWELVGGGGVGILPGYGVPLFRVFLGIIYRPTSHDRDHDRVPDARDKCPDKAEDRDRVQDQDGCPEDDADTDGIPDAQDQCPSEKETINGYEDEDGCPDKGDPNVFVEEGQLRITENIYFRSGSSQIDPKSHSMLNQVALTMKANPQVKRVRIEGHTDDVGPRDMNVRLSKERAHSVRNYLISRGVKPDRLTAEGFGPDKPLVDKKDDEARAKNRRVEFRVEQ